MAQTQRERDAISARLAEAEMQSQLVRAQLESAIEERRKSDEKRETLHRDKDGLLGELRQVSGGRSHPYFPTPLTYNNYQPIPFGSFPMRVLLVMTGPGQPILTALPMHTRPRAASMSSRCVHLKVARCKTIAR